MSELISTYLGIYIGGACLTALFIAGSNPTLPEEQRLAMRWQVAGTILLPAAIAAVLVGIVVGLRNRW